MKQKGFTLIELLVVISIISLLSSVVLASLNSARGKARDVKRLADKRSVMTALNLFYDTNNRWPVALGQAFWVCLSPNSERCWFQAAYPAGQFSGLDSLVADLQPYISSLPINNADAGTLGFNRMMYMDYTPANVAGGPNSPAGAYLIWMQENTMTSAICPGYFVQYDKYWYCHENVGPP